MWWWVGVGVLPSRDMTETFFHTAITLQRADSSPPTSASPPVRLWAPVLLPLLRPPSAFGRPSGALLPASIEIVLVPLPIEERVVSFGIIV